MAAITVLVDDRAGPGLSAEHGLALWIEAAGRCVLFDTGQGGALLPNAKALGIDLATADAIVLSHGHYDHTGGLAAALPPEARAQVFFHPSALRPRYSARGGETRPVGMPQEAKDGLSGLSGGRLRHVEGPTVISPGIRLTGFILRGNDFEDAGGPFFLDTDGTRPDMLEDDLAMWVETAGGLVVVTGCAHAGLVNTLQRIRGISGQGRVRAIIGGFHLEWASGIRIGETVRALRDIGPELIVPCHCTGEKASGLIQAALGGGVAMGKAGQRYEL